MSKIFRLSESETLGHRVAVVGCGAQGRVISTILNEDPDFERIGMFDLKPDVCEAHGKWLARARGSAAVEFSKIDATDVESLTSKLRGYDIVINAVLPKYNLNIMRACLRLGVHYVDMAFGPPYDNLTAELSMDADFSKNRLVALTGAGKAPGLTNLLAAEAADLLDSVKSVKIRLYGKVDASEPIMTWSPATLIEDCSIQPVFLEEGGLRRGPPFGGEELYSFPCGEIGERRVWLHEHEEVYMLTASFASKGLAHCDLKMGGIDEIKSLYELGLLADGPVSVRGTSFSRLELLASMLPMPPTADELAERIRRGVIRGSSGCSVVEVYGKREAKEVGVTLWAKDPDILETVKKYPMATDDSYVVSLSCVQFAKVVLERGDMVSGVTLPERLPRDLRKTWFEWLKMRTPAVHLGGSVDGRADLPLESMAVPVRKPN